MNQRSYIDKISENFSYQGLNGAYTPWPPELQLPADWEPILDKRDQYLKITGSLNFLATHTRPDIAFTVSRLCEGNRGPTPNHWLLLKRVFRYLSATKDLCLVLGGAEYDNDLQPRAYADAAFADNILTRRSTAGHVVFAGRGPVLWKQNAKGSSLSRLPKPNLSILRLRHIDIRYKLVAEQLAANRFTLQHVTTKDMAADGLTKALSKDCMRVFCRFLPNGLLQLWLNFVAVLIAVFRFAFLPFYSYFQAYGAV